MEVVTFQYYLTDLDGWGSCQSFVWGSFYSGHPLWEGHLIPVLNLQTTGPEGFSWETVYLGNDRSSLWMSSYFNNWSFQINYFLVNNQAEISEPNQPNDQLHPPTPSVLSHIVRKVDHQLLLLLGCHCGIPDSDGTIIAGLPLKKLMMFRFWLL